MKTITIKVLTFVVAATIVGLFTIAKTKCDRMASAYSFYNDPGYKFHMSCYQMQTYPGPRS
jgi:hypothetical protein